MKKVPPFFVALMKILDFYKKELSQIINLDRYVIKKNKGRMLRDYKHMSSVIKDEVLAVYDNGEKIKAPFDGYIIMPNHDALIGSEWFYLGRSVDNK